MNRQTATEKALELAGIDREQRIILMTKFSPVPYAEKLMLETRFLFDNQKILWRYDPGEGIWIDNAELFIRSKLRKSLLGEEQQKKNYCEEIIDYIKGLVWEDRDFRDQPKNLIAFQNVLYDIETEKFIDFSPDYFLINKIPIELDSNNIDFGMIDFFIEEIVGKEKKHTVYELMAYCLYRAYPYQKFFILYGGGNNGKSAFLKLLIKFLGVENISSKKPQALIKDKYASEGLFGKLANISPDIPYTELTDSAVIRELTGDDPIDAQKKYGQPFKFFNYSKIIFSANELPQVRDRTYAFDRRIYIIMFDKVIEKKHQDPEIIDKISIKSQLSGLGWHLIKVLNEMKLRGFKFTHDPNEKEMGQLYEELSSSLSKFIKENCVKESAGKIPCFQMNERFIDWLSERGLRIWRQGEIYSYMKDKYNQGRTSFDFYSKEDNKFETKFVRCWEGLSWLKN